jgi:hypothetical protein
MVAKSKRAGCFLDAVRQYRFETSSTASALGINLYTGKFAGARLYCAGVARVLVRKGPWPLILAAASAPEFGRGGNA